MKKVLSTALVTSLILSAIAPAAFAAEELTAQQKFDALKQAGIFTGMEDGSAGLDQSMTRAQIAAVLVRLLGLTEDKAAAAAYKDLNGAGWATGYIGAVTKAKVMEGMGNGVFAPSGEVTTEQMAAILVRALGQTADATATVEGKVSSWAAGYVAAAIKLGVMPASADYTTSAKREALVVASYAAFETLKDVKVEQKVDATAVGAKKFEVKFAAAVDTSKVTFEVKRGTFPANVNTVTWNEAKTVATLEMVANLQKGDYTVTAKGATEPAFTKTITVEDEKVTKVEIVGDKAPIVRGSDNKQVKVFFKIFNQYNEDVTNAKDTNVTFTTGKGRAALNDNQGSFTITSDNEFRLDEPVGVSALYSDGLANQVFAQASLKVATAAQVAKISIEKIAHKTDAAKAVSVSNAANDFVLVLKAEDQYGYAANADLLDDDVVVSVSNTGVLSTKTKTVSGTVYADFDSVKPAGYTADQLVLELGNSKDSGATNWKAGTATVFLYSKTTGAQASYEIKVADVAKVDTFTMDQPSIAVAGEKIEIPFNAVDQHGAAITNAGVLTAAGAFNGFTVSGVSGVTHKFEQDHVNGKAKLILDAEAADVANATNVYLYVYTSTGKQATLVVNLQPKAKASVVSGVAEVERAVAQGATTTLKADKISVYDQYGRTKKLSDFTGAGYKATVEVNNGNVTVDAGEISSANLDVAFTAPTDKDGAAEVTLKLVNPQGNNVSGSEFKFNIRNVKLSDIADYEVADIGKLYANNTMTQGVTVKGLLADGTKVALPTPAAKSNDYYTVTDSTYVSYNNGSVVTQGSVAWGSTSERTETIIITTTNKDKVVKNFNKNVVISNVAPQATTLELRSNGAVNKESDAVVSITKAAVNALTVNQLASLAVKIVDQYGKDNTVTSFNNVVANGWSNAARQSISTVDAGDSFNVTAIANGQTVVFKVIVK